MPDYPYDIARLGRIVQQVRLLSEEADGMLVGRRVKLKRKINSLNRTGTICWVSVGARGVSVGVDIDRLDGQPGVLADTHYCRLNHVEVV